MFRIATFVISALGALVAAPLAAQSLTLVNLPVVYVASPVVQQTHQGRAIDPVAPKAKPATMQRSETTRLAAVRPQAYQPAALPVWKAPAFIDRRFRNYNRGIAQYGPFRVLDDRRVALVGETDASTPGYFRAMMRDFPALEQLDMVECPGTRDDRANLAVGRMIRAAGLVTHVPAIGSVRSGAVELFLAGPVIDPQEPQTERRGNLTIYRSAGGTGKAWAPAALVHPGSSEYSSMASLPGGAGAVGIAFVADDRHRIAFRAVTV